jgi:hypothetical protein
MKKCSTNDLDLILPQFYKHIKLIIDHFYQMIDQKNLVTMSREKQDEERYI